MTNITPGPWRAVRLNPDPHGIVTKMGWEILDEGGYGIVAHAPHIPPIREEANAQLIAAAPDLLAACQDVLLWMPEKGGITLQEYEVDHLRERCKAAIHKAIGD